MKNRPGWLTFQMHSTLQRYSRKPRRSRLAFSPAFLLLLLLMYCGGDHGTGGGSGNPVPPGGQPNDSAGPASASKFLYTGAGAVLGAQINNSTGQLTPVPGSPYANATSSEMDSIVSDPSGRFLYTSAHGFGTAGEVFGQTGIDAFAIDQTTGALTRLTGAPFLTQDRNPIAVHPSGKWVYLPGPSAYHVYAIDNATGVLTEVPGSPFDTPTLQPFSEFSKDGKFLFNMGSDAAVVFSIDLQSGKPSLLANQVSTGVTPGQYEARETRVSGDGKFLYVMANSIGNDPGIIIALAIGQDGSLSPVPGSPFALENFSDGFAVDAAGKFLYASVRVNSPFVLDEIQGFSVDAATGTLVSIAGSPFQPNTPIMGMAVDRSGKFFFAAEDDKCATFSVDANTGKITPLVTSPGPTGGQFGLITMVP